jgi:hypothetical protein
MVVEGLEVLSKREAVSPQVLVSVAQVDVIVDQSSAKETFREFMKDVVGFDWFVIDMFLS